MIRKLFSPKALLIVTALVAMAEGRVFAGFASVSHGSSALPGAAGPAITLKSVSVLNDGTNLNLTLTFFNQTIEGAGANAADALYGFINLDADKKGTTGLNGSYLDANGYESGFGSYSPNSHGVDAYISLSSEADFFEAGHNFSFGYVDVVPTSSLSPALAVAITFASLASGSTATISIPLTFFSANSISINDTGNFSAIVGNQNNATDDLFYPNANPVPEPASMAMAGPAILGLIGIFRRRGGRRSTRPSKSA